MGLGAVDVTRLAEAGRAGQLHPVYRQGLTWQAGWMPPGQRSPMAPELYADDATAAQLAQLLGGSVYQAGPRGVWQGPEAPPAANWIRLPDGGSVLAGDVALGVGVGGSGECGWIANLAQYIPGATVPPECMDSWGGVVAQQQAFGVPYVLPLQTKQSEPTGAGGSSAAVVTGTPGASIGTGGSSPTGSTPTGTNAPSTGGAATQQTLQLPASLTGLPWWAYLAAGGAVLWMMKGK